MSELSNLLDREARRVSAAPGALGSVLRRADRRRRNRRIGTVVFALVVAALATAGLVRTFERSLRPQPARPPRITEKNVAELRMAWTAAPGGCCPMPAVDGATTYVGWNDGITAFPTYCGTGGATCRPTWVGKVNDVAIRGPMSEVTYGADRLTTPVVSDGMVFATDYQHLYAFPTDCATEGKTCEPSWYANPPGGIPGHTVAAAGDGIVVFGSGRELYAYPTHCGAGAHLCRPTWVARGAGQATISNGLVFASDAHHLYAYPTDCHPQGGRCDPLWVGEVTDPTQCCQTAPAVANGLVYIGAGNRLYGFPTSCAADGARCRPSWIGSTGERGAQIVAWALDGDRAFVTTTLGGDLYAPSGHIYAFSAGCDALICRPSWSVEVGGTPYVTAHDGLLFASTFGGFIVAYPEGCVSGTACDPLWSAATFDGGAPFSAPIVTDRGVYSGGNSGRVYVFSIPRKTNG